MKVAIVSRTPLAAAPWELWKALRKYTRVDATLINQFNRYSDGREFPYQFLLATANGAARKALAEADIWHIHNYLIPPLPQSRRKQKVLAQFHSVPKLGNWHELQQFADVAYTIAQPLQEREYRLPGLPNLIDPDEYRPIPKPAKVTIAFAPSTRAPVSHPGSKGYSEVKGILDQVAKERDIEILWIEGRPYLENLKLKSRAHILIDDVITGNWHRTSLEGACFGSVVVNRIDKPPFLAATLGTLREKLLWMIDDRAAREDFQHRTRLWILQSWHAIDQVRTYAAAYEKLLG